MFGNKYTSQITSIMFTAEKGAWSKEHQMWVLVDNPDSPAPFQSIPDTVSEPALTE